jgi:uncharacterized protein YjbI with pentapeptide repeats
VAYDVNTELDPEEKALLRNIGEFNAKIASTGWHLREKDVKEDLSRIRLLNSSMDSVHFLYVNWSEAVITDTQFNGVEFTQSKFIGATFQRVTFTNCVFALSSFQRAKLRDCRFIDCRAEELNARQASFDDCSFRKLDDTSGVFSSAALRKCRFEDCRFENSSFQSTGLVSVFLRDSQLHNVVFGELQGTDLSFENSNLDHTGFGESQYGNVAFERGTNRAVTFTGFKAESLRILKSESIEAFTIMDSTLQRTLIADCLDVSELSIHRSRMANIAIERSQVAYFELNEAHLSGECRFAQTQIAGLSFARSTLVGLRIENCTIAEYLILEDASFERLVLLGVEYAPQLRLRARGVKYLGESARFESR